MSGPASAPCPQCGALVPLVHVHGHGQCPVCHTNVEPCCAGACAGNEIESSGQDAVPFDAHLFERLFLRLGGRAATVSRDSLRLALVDVLDCDLEQADTVLLAGEHVQAILRAGEDCFRLPALPPSP